MSAGSGNNHTPLNLNNLFDRYAKPQFATLGKNRAGQSTSNAPNLLLVFGVLFFVGAFSFSLTRTQTSTNTRASGQITPVPGKENQNVTASIANYPKKYKETEIPQSLYDEAVAKYGSLDNAETKKYVIDRFARFFLYKDILDSNAIAYDAAGVDLTLENIETNLPAMELAVYNSAVSAADFAYVKIRYKGSPYTDRYLSLTGEAEEETKKIIQEYKLKFEQSTDYQAVVDSSNSNEIMKQINNEEKNEVVLNYHPDTALFLDPDFNTFLFQQSPNVTSNIYDLKDEFVGKFGYLVVYPIRVEKKEYDTLDQVIQKNISNFSF